MVSWSADGTLAGYDPVTKKLKKDLYHFASPGTVDLNGATRINYPMGAGLSKTAYPNNPMPTASFSFTSADFTANPGKKLCVGLVMVRADKFPEGHVPTPNEVFNASFDWAQRSSSYVFGPGAITHTFDLPMDSAIVNGLFWSTKWWILLYPSAVTNVNATWSRTNDPVMHGPTLNTVGRVLSFWSNRTPGKPTISSPVDGSTVLPGAEFTLRLNPADPDEATPEDAPKYNDDVNGVHFQYRAAPTAEVPNAEWQDIPFDWEFPSGTDVFKARNEMWNIRGSRYWNGLAGTPYHEALVANLGCSVVAGAGHSQADLQPGKGALPTGNWQVRGRTFDYGHPYPNSGTSTAEPGPLGINPATQFLFEPAKDTYIAENTSPWSDPVTVIIPAQVPPPLIVSPKDATAVSGNTVRLSWQYRNTHQPPRDQYQRTVQIRKVGDAAWSTIFDGISSDSFVDLPRSLVQTPSSPLSALTDADSEAGSQPWLNGNSVLVPSTTITNVNNPAQAHSGNRFIKVTNPPATARPNQFTDDVQINTPVTGITGLPADYTVYTLDGWFWVDASVAPVQVVMQAVWADADGNGIYGEGGELFDTPYVVFYASKFFSGPAQWRRFSDLTPDTDHTDYPYDVLGADVSRRTLLRPPNAVGLIVLYTASIPHQTLPYPDLLTEVRFDDLDVVGTIPAVDDFEMTETNQYEWRVSAMDTDGVVSGFSTPARFWIVPAGASGEVRPIPSETIDGATLGCGTYTVEVYRRGGQQKVDVINNVSHVDWGRMRDDISTAKVVVSGWDIDCGKLLSELQTWAYEIVLWRDNGYSVDRVWEGPITLLTYETDKVTIEAKDVMGYAYRRIIKQAMTDSGTGNGTTVVDRARRIIQNVFAPDDPNVLAYLQALARDDDAMQYRSTPAYSRTAYEEVDDMAANAGLDYTVVGRSIMLWGTKHRIGTLPELRDEDLGASPIVSEYGMEFADLYSVSDGNGVHGEATRGLDPVSGNNTDYGLVEILSSTWASDSESDTGTFTQAGIDTLTQSFKDFAERSISDSFPPPVVVRVPDNTSLNPDTVLSIQSLVPGVVIPLRSTSTLRTVAANQKLDSMKVVCEGGKETISITVSPFSRDDAALTDETDA